MRLSYLERLLIGNLYPKEGDILTQLLVKSIKEKVKLTKEEIKKIGLQKYPNGKLRYESKKEKEIKINFTEDELKLLKEQVNRLDEQKKVTQELLNLCVKIKEEK